MAVGMTLLGALGPALALALSAQAPAGAPPIPPAGAPPTPMEAEPPAAEASQAGDAPPAGFIAGTAVAVATLVAGGFLMAHDQSPQLEKAGVIVMASGFVLAPVVAHGLEGSWRRAALFGGVTLALSAGAVVVMQEIDAFSPHTGNDQRIPMKILLPLSMATSAVGVVMSLVNRRGLVPPRRPTLWLAPAAGGMAAGLGWSAPL